MMKPRFAPAPSTPNCVSTLAPSNGPWWVPPIAFTRPAPEVKEALLRELAGIKAAKLVTDDGNYLHYEFRSMIFRFVDDVELKIDGSAKVIHVRSASRVGRYDFGVNRKRVESLRAMLQGKV